MTIRLVRKREIWWPTRLGWAVLLGVLSAGPTWWWFYGEAFLAETRRVDADILAVEGWIDEAALQSAAREFENGPYHYVVAAGGLTEHEWSKVRGSYAEIAAEALEQAGIDPARILVAHASKSDVDRTHETALAARRALEAQGIEPRGINVFTDSVHARRSRLVFERTFPQGAAVGVVGWLPPGFQTQNWRSSSDRAKEYVMESIAYVYELVWRLHGEPGI